MPSDAADLAPRQRLTIYGYIGFLVFVLPFTNVFKTSFSFFLKDQLHVSAGSLAGFWFIATIPAYFGFLFGFVRDRWAPFGRKDQGILILATSLMVVLFLATSGAKITFLGLLFAVILKGVLDQFVSAAQQGITAVLGQEHVMSGRLSSIWQAVAGVPGLLLSLVAGYCTVHFSPRVILLIAAAVSLLLFGFSWWRPKAIFDDPDEAGRLDPARVWSDAQRLFRAPGIFPCVALLLLWNFTPGLGTPMQFYLTNTLHGDANDWGMFNAVFGGFFIPTYLLHGYLSTRYRLRPILWISTCFAVPQILPLLLVHSASSALWAAVPMGLMGGFATAAYFDLLIRTCPKGLQGTAMMLGSSVWILSGELGNLAGAQLYAWAGFIPCAWATVAVYACQLPVLLFVPKHLTGTRDGEAAAPA